MLLLILAVLFICVAVFYLNGRYSEGYWKKRGAVFYQKNKFLGPFGDFMIGKRAMIEICRDIYKMYPDEPAVGIGSFFSPGLFVRDPVNIQHVVQSDFNAFNHKGFDANKDDVLGDNLILMNGPRWKLVRQSMTPLFTTMKLKNMYYIMDRGAQDFIKYLKDNPKYLSSDTFETLCTFCSAAIGASVFGLGTESVFDSPFLKMAQAALKSSLQSNFNIIIANLSAPLFNFFGIKLFSEHEKFFVTAIKQVIRQRERENINKNDFASMCVNIQKQGVMKDPTTGLEIIPTDELLAGQAFFFFVAGVEPSATAMFSTIIELGNHPDILRRVHEEIDQAFEKSNGKLTYDIVSGLDYLDMSLCEALRLHPPVGIIGRLCIKDTILPVGNIQVEKGTRVTIPIYDIHNDPKYYPEPEKFIPERFSPENRDNIPDNIYMPFGRGPRVCIGSRYAHMQIKTGLVHFLRNYTVKTVITGDKYEFKKQMFQVRISNVEVKLFPRDVKCF